MASNIVVPQLGESVVEARVARWLKKEGDAVTAGEPVVELETEKIDLEVGAEHTGVLEKIARQEGEDVKVGELLGTIAEGAAAAASQAVRASRQGPSGQPTSAAGRQAGEPAEIDQACLCRSLRRGRQRGELHPLRLSRLAGTGETRFDDLPKLPIVCSVR